MVWVCLCGCVCVCACVCVCETERENSEDGRVFILTVVTGEDGEDHLCVKAGGPRVERHY